MLRRIGVDTHFKDFNVDLYNNKRANAKFPMDLKFDPSIYGAFVHSGKHHLDLELLDNPTYVMSTDVFDRIFKKCPTIESGDDVYLDSDIEFSRRQLRDNPNLKVNIRRKESLANVIVRPSLELLTRHLVVSDIINYGSHDPLSTNDRAKLDRIVKETKEIVEGMKSYTGKHQDLIRKHFESVNIDNLLIDIIPDTLFGLINNKIHAVDKKLISLVSVCQSKILTDDYRVYSKGGFINYKYDIDQDKRAMIVSHGQLQSKAVSSEEELNESLKACYYEKSLNNIIKKRFVKYLFSIEQSSVSEKIDIMGNAMVKTIDTLIQALKKVKVFSDFDDCKGKTPETYKEEYVTETKSLQSLVGDENFYLGANRTHFKDDKEGFIVNISTIYRENEDLSQDELILKILQSNIPVDKYILDCFYKIESEQLENMFDRSTLKPNKASDRKFKPLNISFIFKSNPSRFKNELFTLEGKGVPIENENDPEKHRDFINYIKGHDLAIRDLYSITSSDGSGSAYNNSLLSEKDKAILGDVYEEIESKRNSHHRIFTMYELYSLYSVPDNLSAYMSMLFFSPNGLTTLSKKSGSFGLNTAVIAGSSYKEVNVVSLDIFDKKAEYNVKLSDTCSFQYDTRLCFSPITGIYEKDSECRAITNFLKEMDRRHQEGTLADTKIISTKDLHMNICDTLDYSTTVTIIDLLSDASTVDIGLEMLCNTTPTKNFALHHFIMEGYYYPSASSELSNTTLYNGTYLMKKTVERKTYTEIYESVRDLYSRIVTNKVKDYYPEFTSYSYHGYLGHGGRYGSGIDSNSILKRMYDYDTGKTDKDVSSIVAVEYLFRYFDIAFSVIDKNSSKEEYINSVLRNTNKFIEKLESGVLQNHAVNGLFSEKILMDALGENNNYSTIDKRQFNTIIVDVLIVLAIKSGKLNLGDKDFEVKFKDNNEDEVNDSDLVSFVGKEKAILSKSDADKLLSWIDDNFRKPREVKDISSEYPISKPIDQIISEMKELEDKNVVWDNSILDVINVLYKKYYETDNDLSSIRIEFDYTNPGVELQYVELQYTEDEDE